jgi:hypothetical protein
MIPLRNHDHIQSLMRYFSIQMRDSDVGIVFNHKRLRFGRNNLGTERDKKTSMF